MSAQQSSPTEVVVGKQRLSAALYELLETAPLARISVGDICERAGVSRQTFYRHFESKYDIARDYLAARADETMSRVGRDMGWHDSFVALFEMLAQSDETGERLFTKEMLEIAFKHRAESLESTITDYLGLPLTEELQFQIAFFARAEADFNTDHFFRPDLYDRSHFDPTRLADLMEMCVPRELHDLLELRHTEGD